MMRVTLMATALVAYGSIAAAQTAKPIPTISSSGVHVAPGSGGIHIARWQPWWRMAHTLPYREAAAANRTRGAAAGPFPLILGIGF